MLVGEPDPIFGKVEGRRGTEGLLADYYVKIPAEWGHIWYSVLLSNDKYCANIQ